jgi:hypothetical protein
VSGAIGNGLQRSGPSNLRYEVSNPGGVSNVSGPNLLTTHMDPRFARFARDSQARQKVAGNSGASASSQSDGAQRLPRSSQNQPSTEIWTAERVFNLTPEQMYHLPQAEFAAAAREVLSWGPGIIRSMSVDQIASWYFCLVLKSGWLGATALDHIVRGAFRGPADGDRWQSVNHALDNMQSVSGTAEINRNTLLRDYPQHQKNVEEAVYLQMRPVIERVVAGQGFPWSLPNSEDLLRIATGMHTSTISTTTTMAATTDKRRTGWNRCLFKHCPGNLAPWVKVAGPSLGTQALRNLAASNNVSNRISPPGITTGTQPALPGPPQADWRQYAFLGIPAILATGVLGTFVYNRYNNSRPAAPTALPGGPQAEVELPLIPLPTQARSNWPQHIPSPQRRYSV